MKKNNSLAEAFTDANKEICKAGIAVEPKDVYLAYCALALCTIADKMGEEEPELRSDEHSKRYRGYHAYDYFDPKEEKHDQLS